MKQDDLTRGHKHANPQHVWLKKTDLFKQLYDNNKRYRDSVKIDMYYYLVMSLVYIVITRFF